MTTKHYLRIRHEDGTPDFAIRVQEAVSYSKGDQINLTWHAAENNEPTRCLFGIVTETNSYWELNHESEKEEGDEDFPTHTIRKCVMDIAVRKIPNVCS